MRRSSPPLWFELALLAGCAAVAHTFELHALENGAVLGAWFGWVAWVAQAIWTGLQVVGQITLAAVHWSVVSLWSFAQLIYNVLLDLSQLALSGLAQVWDYARALYDNLLKPLWNKFWKLVDWARGALERVFKPILGVLKALRKYVLDVYEKFVRPVLDTIDIIRKALRVLSSVGVEWAKQLDAKLAALEERITEPILFVVRKVNEVINLVNRIVTADGLFQRLALIRSIERDVAYVSRSFLRYGVRPLTDEEKQKARAPAAPKTIEEHADEFGRLMQHDEGPLMPLATELAADLRIFMQGLAAR